MWEVVQQIPVQKVPSMTGIQSALCGCHPYYQKNLCEGWLGVGKHPHLSVRGQVHADVPSHILNLVVQSNLMGSHIFVKGEQRGNLHEVWNWWENMGVIV